MEESKSQHSFYEQLCEIFRNSSINSHDDNKQLENIQKDYARNKNCSEDKGRYIIVTGEESSGKSTFINLLLSFLCKDPKIENILNSRKNAGNHDKNRYIFKFGLKQPFKKYKIEQNVEKKGEKNKIEINEFQKNEENIYQIDIPTDNFKGLRIVRYPTPNSQEKSHRLCNYIVKKRAYCCFLKDMSTPDTFSENMVDIFRFECSEEMAAFIWVKSDKFFKIDPEDYSQFNEEEEDKTTLEKLIYEQKVEVLKKRRETLKKSFHQIGPIKDYHLTKKPPEDLSGFFKEIMDKVFDQCFQNNYNESIYQNQIFSLINNNIDIRKQKNQTLQTSLTELIDQSIQINEFHQLLKNDLDIWNLKNTIAKDSNSFKMPKILNERFSEKEVRELINKSRVNEEDLFFVIESSYFKKIENPTPKKNLNDEIQKLERLKEEFQKSIKLFIKIFII